MKGWILCDRKLPEDGQHVIVVSLDDEPGQEDGYITWFAVYKNKQFMVVDFDDAGWMDLTLKAICWQPLPECPFVKP